MRMPPGATDVGAREDYELRDGASPSALERCAISAVRRGYGHAVEPSFVRAELADRAPHSQSPMRTHAESSALVLCAIRHIHSLP